MGDRKEVFSYHLSPITHYLSLYCPERCRMIRPSPVRSVSTFPPCPIFQRFRRLEEPCSSVKVNPASLSTDSASVSIIALKSDGSSSRIEPSPVLAISCSK